MYGFTRGLMAGALGLALTYLACAPAQAQTLLDQVQLVSNPAVAPGQIPPTQTFTVSAAGSYTVTLTDLESPAALGSLQLAIASASATVLQLSAAGTSNSQAVTLQPGIYYEQVLASPSTANAALGGSFSATVTAANGSAVPVTPVGGQTPSNAFVDAVAGAGPSPPPGQSVLQTQFTVTSAGAYQLALADLAFPAALHPASLDIAVWNQASPGTLVFVEAGVDAGNFALGTLSAGTYQLVVVAQAASPAYAGLYGLTIGAGTNSVLAMTVPVGTLPAGVIFGVPLGGSLQLTLGDLAWPTPLASLQALMVQGATVLQPSVDAGTYTVNDATAGSAQLFVAAEPTAAAGEGSFTALISQGGQTLLDIAQPVTDSSHYGYAFMTNQAAGSYKLGITDFAVPAALGSLGAVAEQNAVELGMVTTSGGSATLSPQQAGPVNVVAFAAPAAQAAGLFGLALTSVSSGTVAYQTTQGVGEDFASQQVAISTAGEYQVNLVDLAFPASFATLKLIVTSGEQNEGQISDGGKLSFQATPGTYTLNVLADTGTSQGAPANYGLYGVQVAAVAPPAPAAPASSSSGGSGAVSPIDLAILALALYRVLRARRLARRSILASGSH